jgi:hypothetical protein
MAITAAACLAMAAPAAAQSSVFLHPSIASGGNTGLVGQVFASKIIGNGSALALGSPSEVGVPSSSNVCVPAGPSDRIALNVDIAPFAPSEVGAVVGSNAASITETIV